MAITSAIMQMRRGYEADFDADKMRPGEWAVSTDEKYVRMCFSPGVCVRMATYEAFEKDMEQIKEILSTCETIEEAVSKINTEVSANAQAVEEYTEQAKQYRDEAKQFRDEAEQFAPDGYIELKETVASNTVKIDTIIEKAELNIKNSASGSNIHLTDSANGKNVEFGLYGKATQDGEPTPDNPIEIVVSGSDGSVEVVSCRKNLLQITATSQTVKGVTFTVDNGCITVNGTATEAFFIEIGRTNALEAGNYTISGCPNGGSETTFNFEAVSVKAGSNGWVTRYIEYGNEAQGSINGTDSQAFIANIRIRSGVTVNNLVFKPMISIEGGEYQPYTETISTIPTPNGLCGIKVSSGGNYTDENGQQWICDEVVKYADGSGKRIQRVGKSVLSSEYGYILNVAGKGIMLSNASTTIFPNIKNASNYNVRMMSNVRQWLAGNAWDVGSFGVEGNTFWFEDVGNVLFPTIEDWTNYLDNNEVIMYYEFAEPIITDLSAEEIAEIEKLYTFYPVTNISNDADCGMSVTYLCDAKNYIDNRLALIETALVNSI